MAKFGEYFKQNISSMLTPYPPPDVIAFFDFSLVFDQLFDIST